MPIGNRIVTRGMGPTRGGVPGRASMVVQGYGGFFQAVAKAAVRLVRIGQSGTKRALRELEDVLIGAKLIRVNDEKPKTPVQGFVRVKVDMTRHIAVMAEGFTKRVRAAWEDIKITVKRIR